MKTTLKSTKNRLLAGLSAIAFSLAGTVSTSYAGPFILAGTDADDHGSFNGTTNVDGWLFM